MNEKDAQSISDMLIEIYVFVKAHYYYYTGVLMRMFFTKWNFKDFIKYFLASLLLVQLTKHLLETNATPQFWVLIICVATGFVGHTSLKYTIDEALPRILKALTDRIIDIINKR